MGGKQEDTMIRWKNKDGINLEVTKYQAVVRFVQTC